MTTTSKTKAHCSICERALPLHELRPFGGVRAGVSRLISLEYPEWKPGGLICHDDLARFRSAYVETLLTDERGELGNLERQVLQSLETGQMISQNLLVEEARQASFGERAADKVAAFGGSWMFILLFTGFLIIWMTINVIGILKQPFDPYPFILLNLALSSVAALQAPVIMMSQRRQETKDRLRGENDYLVNLKAELEIRQLHEKIDHQLAHQWEKLAEMQQIQIDILQERVSGKR